MTKARSKYAKKFDKSIPSWTDDREFNMEYLRTVQSYYNDLLMARGYVFLRDIYERIGIPITEESIVVGWYYDRNDHTIDNYIDFHLYDAEEGSEFVLDFNVDGDIRKHF